ncbi:MAG: spore coat protein CotH [Clostridiales bacterium]|nr:spore coat protein CotH [Clostridiales bacterium]
MRNRFTRIMFLLTVLALASGGALTIVAGDPPAIREYQHRMAAQPDSVTGDEEGFLTHLPIISIKTNGQDVPGERIGDDVDGTRLYTLSEEGGARITVDLAVYDSGGVNRVSDSPKVSSQARIRYRGNYSRWFYKKSYAVSLIRNDGTTPNPHTISGLPSHDEWVLHGPWIDRTLLRNYLAYNVAGEIMSYAPGARFVELVLDGEHHGIYVLVEPITRGAGRLSLRKPDDGKDVTSFIVRWDRATKSDQRLDNFLFYTYRSDLSALDVRYPGKQNITPGRMDYIERTISQVERTLYSADMKDPRKGYYQYLDLESFAQYFLINEFFRNVDAGRYSTFLYKDVRGKVKLVVWDFDNAGNNYIDRSWTEAGFSMQNAPWFSALLMDDLFVDLLIKEYRTLRSGALNEDYLLRTIDETVAYLGNAVDRNYEKWGRAFDMTDYNGLDYLIPVQRNYTSYDESVQQFKGFIVARGRWLDDHIETLRQYSQDSKTTTILNP